MDSNFLEQLAQLELRHKKFSLVGSGDVQAAGSLKTGFAVNVEKRAPTPAPTLAIGACCAGDGSCSITTFADCTGTWKGPATTCDPNPCDICINCDIETITVTFTDVLTCPPYVDINLNGTFTLTRFESCGWVGTGGQFDQGFGPQDAFIFVTCVDGVINVIYSGDTGFADIQFFVGRGSTGALLNNTYITCDDGGAGSGGTVGVST